MNRNTQDNTAAALIRAAGLRPTTARVAILNSLTKHPNHPTANQLARRLRRFGRATIYQNLDKLAGAGVIATLTTGDGLRRFDATLEPHQHFVDTKTGRIYDVVVESSLLKKLKPIDPTTGKAFKNAKVGEVRVQFYGRS